MPLEFRKQRDGSLRPVWFGRFEINGERFCYNLGVKIAGTPPASLSLKDEGDIAFERSRVVALAKLDQIIEEARTKHDSARLVEKLYEIKTGEAIRSVKLEKLADEWIKFRDGAILMSATPGSANRRCGVSSNLCALRIHRPRNCRT